jgi:hypothetical protein
MTTTRRNAVKFIAGSAVGVMFTPAPWHFIRDTTLWSESWPGIPEPKHGPVTFKTAQCTLCPGGCAVKARCVADQPVSIAGVDGGLCPLGVTGHHLPYHPRRLKSGPVEEAKAAVQSALAHGARPAVLDLRPGRPASAAYRKAMVERNGFYMAPPQPAVTVDLAAARTVISVGVPLFEGWLPPAKVWAARNGFRLVQIEPMLSRTATLADEWLPACTDVAALARKCEGPVLVIDAAMSAEIVALNRELGGWGKTVVPIEDEAGGRPLPDGRGSVSGVRQTQNRERERADGSLISVPDGAIGVLYIDESGPGAYLPWPEIAPKLAPDAVVVALTWWRDGYARHTRLALPTPVYPEPELIKAPEGTVDAAEFIVGQALSPANPTAATSRVLPGGSAWPAVGTPLFTKLYQESGLLLAPGQVALPPSSGFAPKDRAYMETPRGRLAVEVVIDAAIPAGRFDFVPTPELLDLGTKNLKVVRA